MQLHVICLILIIDGHKWVMSSYMMGLLYLDVLPSKQLRLHHLIMQKFMKRADNVFGSD